MIHPERRKENLKKIEEMDKLKPCPFCGREVRAERYVEEVDYDICWIEHIANEPICFLHSARGYVGKKSDLIELWNRRHKVTL